MRRFRIGIGTVLALVIALGYGGFRLYQQQVAAKQPPVIERSVQGTARGIAPAPEFLLHHAQELALTPAQGERVQQVATAYRKDVAPMRGQLDAATTAYQQYLAQSSAARPDARQLTERAAEVQRLSAAVATARHAYWEQARAQLSAEQQKTLDGLLPKATAADLQ